MMTMVISMLENDTFCVWIAQCTPDFHRTVQEQLLTAATACLVIHRWICTRDPKT